MEVLTKILQQGTEFDTLAETVLADRFERLVELVTMMGDQGELPIAMALANVVPGSQWVSHSGQDPTDPPGLLLHSIPDRVSKIHVGSLLQLQAVSCLSSAPESP